MRARILDCLFKERIVINKKPHCPNFVIGIFKVPDTLIDLNLL